MNPHDEITTSVPENDFLAAARAVDTGRMPSETESIREVEVESYTNEAPLNSLSRSVQNVLSDYPGPAALIGAGLVWMLISRERRAVRPLPTRIKESAIHRKDQILEAVHNVKEHAQDAQQQLMERARVAKEEAIHGFEEGKFQAELKAEQSRAQANQRIGEMKHSAEERAQAVKSAYDHILEDNPLILGACAMIAGIALGLLVPATEREDQIMGAQRDSLLDQARSIVDNARQAAVETLRSGTENVKSHLVEAADSAREALQESVESAKQAAAEDIRPTTDPVI